MQQKPLLVIVGPTAAGKSDLAVRLALEFSGEVISADSVQVYKGFDVGTGKISAEEQQGVPHHLLDILDPDEPFSAARFVELADQAIADIHRRARQVVVAGGSGLYVKALLRGLFEAPAADEALRREHCRVAREQSVEELHQRLKQVDAQASARIDPHDLVRISRALEVFAQTGRTITSLQQEHRFAEPRYPSVIVGLNPPRQALWQRIEQRVHWMMEHGWRQEVEALKDAGYGESHPMGALGYRRLMLFVQGELDLDEAVRQTVRDTRRFARRQIAWFSNLPEVHWFEDAREVDRARVRAWLQGE